MRESLAEGNWEVVISDYSMPDFTVFGALSILRERDLDLPFLIVSATILDEEAIAAMKAGAHDFIMKDKLARLGPAIERELRECRIRRERKDLEQKFQQAQRLEGLGLLAGGIAHDFNNLLTGILGNASLALDILDPPEPGRSMLREVITASERAADLTRQLLAYAGKGRFHIQSTNISHLVRDITELIHTSIPKKVQLTLDLDEDLPPVEADRSQLQQLVMNLVINAGEACSGLSGFVQVSTSQRQIHAGSAQKTPLGSALDPGWYVSLKVQDSGCGMDEATISRIFDPFFSTKFTGRGLGLAAALGIVHGHKGAMSVDSSPGRGSTFEVLLPTANSIYSGDSGVPVTEAAGKQLTGAGAILVVDDEEVVRHTAKAVLERYGYTVIEAVNGLDGVTQFEKRQDDVSLVLLDLTMPMLNGEEVLERLREIRPGVIVLLSSGYDEAQASQRFAGKGINGFVKKPYTGPALARKVKAALEESSN
jgi:signal transduction histidine kinase/ActR/RegA family two-component response regulator